MTSGGLLAALAPGRGDQVPGGVIGRLTDGTPGTIAVS
jgi:hypothetical protein